MKKVLLYILSLTIALMFCSCTKIDKGDEYVDLAEKYGYQSLFNVSYGMSVEDTRKALGVTSDEFTQEALFEYGEKYRESNINPLVYKTSVKYRDKAATAMFIFMSSEKSDIVKEPILGEILVMLNDELTVKEVFEGLDVELNQDNFSYKFSDIFGTIVYTNNSKLSKIDSVELKKQTLNVVSEWLGYNYREVGHERPFDRVTIYHEEYKCVIGVQYTGILAAISAYLAEEEQ